MKKFFILLMVVIMLTGLTFSSFAVWTGKGVSGVGDQIRDCLKDGTGSDCTNPDGCDPIGDGPQYRGGK